MLKPDSLRAFLTASNPELSRNPDKLRIHIDSGRIITRLTSSGNLGFEYHYQINITLIDYSQDPSTVFLPLTLWLRSNQANLLLNHSKGDQDIKFEVDILDAQSFDIAITLPLTESVDVLKNPNGSYVLTHRSEPAIIGTELIDGVDPATIINSLYSNGQWVWGQT